MPMYVAYCKAEAPATKLVVGWGDVEEAVSVVRHADHPDAEDGHFTMSDPEWASVQDPVPAVIVTNIVTNFGSRFV